LFDVQLAFRENGHQVFISIRYSKADLKARREIELLVSDLRRYYVCEINENVAVFIRAVVNVLVAKVAGLKDK